MGRLGYQSEAQSTLAVSFNNLQSYAASLNRALSAPWPAYEAIGLRDGDDYRQLATSLLQIENEFYGTIRPKQVVRSGERPLRALGERGIEYVEVRCVDINPFDPVGIDADSLRLLDLFLLHCALTESPPDSPAEIAVEARNQQLVAEHGRDPEVRLDRSGAPVAPTVWAGDLLEQFGPIADALDEAHGGRAYRADPSPPPARRCATRRGCRRRACCARPRRSGARRSPRSPWHSRGSIGKRCSTGRSPPPTRRATGRWPRTRWPSSGASRPPTTFRSRRTASATSGRT